MTQKPIIVIGSSNMDLVAQTPRIPVVGETLTGTHFFMTPGGKGANQAVAAARLGGDVTFVARLGDDVFAQKSLDNFNSVRINTSHIKQLDNTPSGVALIAVDENGRNSIIVIPGANAKLLPADIDQAEADIKKAGVIVTQLETPMETVEYASTLAKKYGVPFILDPAPARPLSKDLIAKVDILKPNEIEAEELTGVKITDRPTASLAAQKLLDAGVKTAIITLGDKGLIVADTTGETFIERIQVKAIDSTAAGDSFTGALAVGIAQGRSVAESAVYANYVAAMSVTKLGAQSSMPTRDEVDQFIGTNKR